MSYFLLPPPQHDEIHLPVPFRPRPAAYRRDTQIVREFREKLQLAEEMISKLAFSLSEIQNMKRKPRSKRRPTLAQVTKLLRVGDRESAR
jgi:hypothetical protein